MMLRIVWLRRKNNFLCLSWAWHPWCLRFLSPKTARLYHQIKQSNFWLLSKLMNYLPEEKSTFLTPEISIKVAWESWLIANCTNYGTKQLLLICWTRSFTTNSCLLEDYGWVNWCCIVKEEYRFIRRCFKWRIYKVWLSSWT